MVFLGVFFWVLLGGFFWVGFLMPTLILNALIGFSEDTVTVLCLGTGSYVTADNYFRVDTIINNYRICIRYQERYRYHTGSHRDKKKSSLRMVLVMENFFQSFLFTARFNTPLYPYFQ